MAVDLSLTPGQLGEIWQAATVEEGIALLRHISAGDDAEAGGPPAPAEEILLEFLYGALAFCKEQGLAAPKALAFLAVMQQTHALATSDLALTREDVLAGFAEKFLAATKALPAADRFALAEVQLLTQRARETLVRHLKLFQLVATQSQTLRESFAELFVQVPAKPPPLASFAEGDGAAAAPAEPEAPPAEQRPQQRARSIAAEGYDARRRAQRRRRRRRRPRRRPTGAWRTRSSPTPLAARSPHRCRRSRHRWRRSTKRRRRRCSSASRNSRNERRAAA